MSLKTRLASLLAALFGRISWQGPAWLVGDPATGSTGLFRRAVNGAKANRVPLLATAVLAAAGGGVYHYVTTRPPPPDQITLTASTLSEIPAPPRRLASDPVPTPAMLTVSFSSSAAPLEALDKPVVAGVSLSPKIEGTWRWVNERLLGFTPTNPWPIAEKFTVSLAQQLVNRPNVVLVTRQLTFTTGTFTVSPSAEFYQDPVDPSIKQVVGTYRFSYPVDAASFEKRLSLTAAPASNPNLKSPVKFTVTYDSLNFEAYVRSESLPLPIEDHRADMVLEAGTVPQGSSQKLEARTASTTIPGKGSKFRVNQVVPNMVQNADGDPDQVLVFDCTSQVNEKNFAAAVKAWVLPKGRPAYVNASGKTEPAVERMYWDVTRVGPDDLKRGSRLTLAAIPGEHESESVQSFKFNAKPGTTLFIRVEAGVEAFGGYVLLKPFEAVVTVPEYPREIKIAHDGSLLSLTGEKKLTVSTRGLPGFKVHLYRIQPKDLNHLITQSAGDLAHLSLRYGSFTEENISEIFSEVHSLDASNPKVAQYDAVDFSKYLKEGGTDQRGMYFVRVEAWNPKTQQPINAYAPTTDEEDAPPPTPSEDAEQPEALDRGEGDQGEGEGYEGDGSEGDGSNDRYQDSGQLTDQRFVMLTDLGVVDKVDVGLNHWVFVQSFRSGTPVAFAQIEVLAKNGSIVLKQTTDANGAATLPPFKDFLAEKTPVALVVRKDGDVSFLPLNRSDRMLDLSRFDIGGVRTKGSTAALTAFAFSDRGLYRPGEVAHLATLIRAVDWSRSVKGTPLQLIITDPRGVAVAVKDVTLDGAGFTGMDFKTEESSQTGTYNFTVYVPSQQHGAITLGSTNFRVEEFLPDRMRLTTRIDGPAQGWVTGTTLKAVAELRNLFGTPAADHRVSANVTLQPYQPQFSKYPDYFFHDPSHAARSESRTLDDTTTSAEGDAEYEIDLSAWAPSTWRVSFYAEGFELGGGRSVSSLATIIASPRSFMLGSKSDGDTQFVKRNAERNLHVIAVDPKVNPIKVDKLKLVLIEQRYVSVLTRDPNGSYRYQSVLKDVTKKTEAFDVGETGTKLKVPTTEVGQFYFSVRDSQDIELLNMPFTVMGEANLAKELEKNAELKVTLDKGEYEPGETISVQITAPYAGSGVITIERDKVLVHKPFKTTTSSTVQTIDVPAGLEVTGYVNVAFVRSIDSPELYVSPLSYGVVPFKVLKKSQHLQLTVKSPELARPGRSMAIAYKTDKPAKIALFAVDEGILQVAHYETPDPLAFFLEKRALEVRTWQIVDLLLPEFRLVHRGGKEGGDGDGAIARNLNPFKRKADVPAVFWSGIVDSGPDEKSVSFTVPESFNGQLRVMAVAASPDALAAVQTKTTIRGPFVISPNTPNFVSPNDTFVVTAAIANNVEGSGDKAEVTVSMKPSAAFVLAPGVKATQVLTIAERREGVVSFDVKATDVLGDGELQFQVSGSKQEATRTAHISIRPSSAYLATAQVGSAKSTTVQLPVKRTMFDQFAKRELTVSFLPLGMSSGLVSYLDNYEHLCSEQLTSRAVPALVLMKRPDWGYDAAMSKSAFDRAFSVMRTRQNEQGEFGYWAANGHHYETLDVFITLMLTEAKERGVNAPNDVRLKALENLKRATLPVSTIEAARLRAQQLYVLARNAVVAPAPTAQLAEFLGRQKETTDVAYAYLAATYALTNNPERAQEVIKRFSLADDVVPNETLYYDGSVYRAQVLYLFAKHFPSKLDDVGGKVLTQMAKVLSSGYGMHSLGASWTLYALDAYSTSLEKAAAGGGLKSVTIEVSDAKGVWKKQDTTPGLTAKVGFDKSTTGFKVTVGEGSLVFYSLTESGFDRELPTKPIAEGLEVIHTFEDDQGKPVTSVALGDEITVHLKTRSATRANLSNIALTDLLPSGFEVVMSRGTDVQGLARLSSAGSNWAVDEVDIREDRVNFYGSVTPVVRDVKYRIKAVAKGTFVVPPAQAVGMYQPEIRARSLGGSMVVE